jgi:hypothetical protein
MPIVDHEVRSLISDGMSSAPSPLTSSDIARRAHELRLTPQRDIRPRRTLMVGVIGVAAVLIGGVLVIGRSIINESGESQNAALAPTQGPSIGPAVPAANGSIAPGRVGTYFLPGSLPDGWRILDIEESGPGNPQNEAVDSILYERKDPPAMLSLYTSARADSDVRASYANTLDVPDANVATWGTLGAGRGERGTIFAISWDDAALWGSAIGLSATDVEQLVPLVHIDELGYPIVDPATGFDAVAKSPAEPLAMDARLSILVGTGAPSSESEAFMMVEVVRRETAPPDSGRGVGSEPLTLNGREMWVDYAGPAASSTVSATWVPSPNVSVRVIAPPIGDGPRMDAAQAMSELSEVPRDTFEDAVDAITAGSEVSTTHEFTLDGGDLRLETRTLGQAAWWCLVGPTDKVCRSRRSLSEAPAFSALVDGKWYVVTASQSTGAVSPVVDSATWAGDAAPISVWAIADDVNLVRWNKSPNPTEYQEFRRPPG